MTYGWAILVTIIFSVFLWQMGVFDFGSPTPGYRGFSQVKPLDWKASTTNNSLHMIITNEAGSSLLLPANGISATVGTVNCGTAPLSTVDPFRPGQSLQVIVSCPGLSGSYEAGDYYRANVTITYQNPGSGIGHNSVGIIFGPAE